MPPKSFESRMIRKRTQTEIPIHFCLVVSTLLILFVMSVASHAHADSSGPLDRVHSEQEIQQAEAGEMLLTDLQAASTLPHRDLEREEAASLLRNVFGPLLESSTGVYSDLDVERFLSNNAAVISSSEAAELFNGAAPQDTMVDQPVLLESSTPLRTEGPSGEIEPVNLDLTGTFGPLRPVNPLVEVVIPELLGDGIELPESGIQIKVDEAPEGRAASTLDGRIAFYPNIARDTDLAVVPTAAGVETVTQLRSPDAPTEQTLDLELPDGAMLEADATGGARVVQDGHEVVKVRPPTATDARGDAVPVQMGVSGSSLRLTVAPGDGAAYPIAVDPYVEDAYNWYYDGHPGWTPRNTGGWTNAYRAPDTGCSTYCFLRTSAMSGTYEVNTQTYWEYQVPRFESDWSEVGKRPNSWIQAYSLGFITFATAGDWKTTPSSLFAVSDQNGAWRQAVLLPPNQSGGFAINLNSDHTGKLASFGLFTTALTWISSERYLLTGTATVTLGDDSVPVIEEVQPPAWVDTTAKPFNFAVSDYGLGVYDVSLRTSGGTILGSAYLTGCNGTVRNTCPRRLRGAQDGHTIPFNPSGLPQGSNILKLEATDPLHNAATGTVEVRVDHTAPQISLSGTMTEQATLGTTLPQYTLRTEAKDGIAGSPQSGIVKTEVKVDGKVVSTDPSWSPGCSTQNCALTKEWVLTTSEYSLGKHTVEVTTIDGVGRKAMKSVTVELAADGVKPSLAGSGSLISGPQGWVEQKSYAVTGKAEDPKGFGITKIQLLIDGKVFATSTQSCASGGCSMSRTYFVNTGSQTGGDHTVSLVANDGAGNLTESSWDIYVDPKGQVSADEVTQTLESYEETTDGQPVASTEEVLEPGVIEGGDNPGFEKAGEEYVVTGVPIEATVGITPAAGFTLEGEDGEIEVAPVGTPPSTEVKLAGEESAAVVPSSGAGIDTVIRAEYNGLMAFQAIREPTSPESSSWTINMSPNQALKAIDSEHAAVYWPSGDEAFRITAETAHDATGKAVPTRLEVSGSNLILVVEHRKEAFVYPVTAGTAYETSYVIPTIIEMPEYEGPPPPPEPEEFDPPPPPWNKEQEIHALDFSAEPLVAPVAPTTGPGEYDFQIYRSLCGKSCGRWKAKVYNATVEVGSWGARWESGTKVMASMSQDARWAPLLLLDTFNCGARPPSVVHKGSNEHLAAWGHFTVTKVAQVEFKGVESYKPGEKNFTLEAWVWPNGWQERRVQGWNGAAPHNCPTVAT